MALLEQISGVKKVGEYSIITDKLIGQGHYGKVYLAYKTAKNGQLDKKQPLVCKVIERAALSEKGEKMVKNEIANLELVESDGVIRLFKTFKTSTHFYIMTEFCNGGDVSELLEARGGKISEAEARILISKVAYGLSDMHDAGVMHRDLKLANILLNFKGGIKLPSGQTIN